MRNADETTIAIVGAGSIGVAWAVTFAAAGRAVALHDPDPQRLAAARCEVAVTAAALARRGLIAATPDETLGRLRTAPDLADALTGAVHVQECAPEQLELKRALFGHLGALTGEDTVLASSSSAIPIGAVARDLPARARCLVVHPLNPPFALKVVEIVPADFTAPETVARASRTIAGAGLVPVALGREIEGFLFNRLQGALLREAYCLVRDGVATVAQVDQAVSAGLGRRWSLIGPFETVDLNTRGGIAAHAQRMGPAYARMGAERGQNDPWTPDLVATVAAQRRTALPLDRWTERGRWRDERLMDLAALLDAVPQADNGRVWETARLTVQPGSEEAFLAAAAACVPLFRRAAGCRGVQMRRALEGSGPFLRVAEWRTQDDLDRFLDSADAREWDRSIGDHLAAPPAMERTRKLPFGF